MDDYVKALRREIAHWGRTLRDMDSLELPFRVSSIYLGGGTPSLLRIHHLESILYQCRSVFAGDEGLEVSLEANPGTLDRKFLEQLRAVGINRLSLGVQSFDGATLKFLGRIHSAREAKSAYLWARQAGFDNISLDLIYGIPAQTIEQWRCDLSHAIDVQPDHLSLYPLTIEDDTPFGRSLAKGELPPPDPDLAAEMYVLAEELLARSGYRHYEISNWALAGERDLRCRHNLIYWHNGTYLGFGAGAHSFFGHHRFSNVSPPTAYIEKVSTMAPLSLAGSILLSFSLTGPMQTLELIPPGLEMAETVILGLRLMDGLSRDSFRQSFGRELHEVYGPQIDDLVSLGLLESDGKGISLTRQGRLLGNEVFFRFLPHWTG